MTTTSQKYWLCPYVPPVPPQKDGDCVLYGEIVSFAPPPPSIMIRVKHWLKMLSFDSLLDLLLYES